MSEVERVNDVAEQGDAWPAPVGEPRSPLPRLEDLPLAEHGYDPEGVRAAFDSFYRHIAQMDGTLRAIESVEVFRAQAGELRRELRALKAAGWAPQPLRSAYQARAGRPRGAGMPEALPRIALEAGFLIVVAVLLAAAHFDKLEIVLIMALAWAIVGIVEWAASQERLRLRRPAAPTPAAARTATAPRAGAESPAELESGEAAESAGWAAYSRPAEPAADGAEALTVVDAPADEAQPAEPEPSEEPVGESPVVEAEPPEAEIKAAAEPEQEPEPVAVELPPVTTSPAPEPEPVALEIEPEPVAIEPEPEFVAVEPEPEPVAGEPDLEPVAAQPEPLSAAAVPDADPQTEPEPEPEPAMADADIEIVGEPDVEIDPEPAAPSWSWGQDAHASSAPNDRRRWLPWRRRSAPEAPVVLRPRGHVRVLPSEASPDGPVLASEDIDRILDPWEQDFDLSVEEPGEVEQAQPTDEQPAAAAGERDS